MRAICLILLCLSGSLGAVQTDTPVQHAPTLQACEADFNLWSSQIKGFPTSTTEQDQEGTKLLTVTQIVSRLSYLDDCSRAYPVLSKNRPGELSALFSLELIYVQEIQKRQLDFLSRHGLTEKFYAEDDAGMR